MSEKRDFLVEIGTEELPPKALGRLASAFADGICEGLNSAELNHGEVRTYASPRRLAVSIKDVDSHQADKHVERRGPALIAAFDDEGEPSKAALGFAGSCGVDISALEKQETDKGSWLVHRYEAKGKAFVELAAEIVEHSLARLPIPKRMRWGNREAQFVRPAHWVVMLFGLDVIEGKVLGIETGRETLGHRFHHTGSLTIAEPRAYAALLESEGHVIADFDTRKRAIEAQVAEAGLKLGGEAVIDEALLDEVTALVEWPQAVVGDFDAEFLDVPQEALISAMKGHQKYFHVVDRQGQLMPHFITVSNIESSNVATVKQGNERVIRPRLADAEFFWTQDKKHKLDHNLKRLRDVVFQKKLGSLYDKSERVVALTAFIARQLGADVSRAERAAWLAKCDLMSEMVGEFPELQGIMGRYYALHDDEGEDVANALLEQYLPRFGGDEVAASSIGQSLAIAEKIDTLVGIFAIGQSPSGDKDPFGLRRAALGVQRTLIENGLPLDLKEVLAASAEGYKKSGIIKGGDDTFTEVYAYMQERLRGYYTELDIPGQVYDAVRAVDPSRPADFHLRMQAVDDFRQLDAAAALAAANKRTANILRKSGEHGAGTVDAGMLSEKEELALWQKIQEIESDVKGLVDRQEYKQALTELSQLRETVDAFFDKVMVMAEDKKVRANRLALLHHLSRLFTGIADISRL